MGGRFTCTMADYFYKFDASWARLSEQLAATLQAQPAQRIGLSCGRRR